MQTNVPRNKFIKTWVFPGFILALCLFLGAEISSAASKDDLQKIEQDIKSSQQKNKRLKAQSKNLTLELKALRKELIQLSQSVQQRETNVTQLESNIRTLIKEETAAKKSLEERHGQSVKTLIALQRLALNPPEAIIAMPQLPGDMVRSAILLRAIVPQIQSQAIQLRKEVSEYTRKRTLLEKQKKNLNRANYSLSDERQRLKVLIKDKKTLSARFNKQSNREQRRLASLTKRAKTLQGLLAKIKQDKLNQARKEKAKAAKAKSKAPSKAVNKEEIEIVLGKPPSGKPITKSKGKLSNPASGPIVMKYGQKEKLGGKHKGISIKTRDRAQIVATYDGQIAFAGPFRGYKRLLIIDHGEGYHTLLTGMERIDVTVGQWLLSGEPVGVMSQNASRDANLYFELRKNGAPINPLPWIGRRNAKARG